MVYIINIVWQDSKPNHVQILDPLNEHYTDFDVSLCAFDGDCITFASKLPAFEHIDISTHNP